MKNWFFLFLLLIFSFTLFSLVSALTPTCNEYNLCYNDHHQPFCSPHDETCEFIIHEWNGSSCVGASKELDSDGDGWTDTCDAFPQNPDEWLDYDGDMIGHNADCDDRNASIGECAVVNETVDEQVQRDDHEPSANDGAPFLHSVKIITDEDEEPADTDAPVVVKESVSDGAGVLSQSHVEEEPVVQHAEQDLPSSQEPVKGQDGVPLTGAAITHLSSRTSWSLGFIIFIIVMVLFVVFFKKRSRKEHS